MKLIDTSHKCTGIFPPNVLPVRSGVYMTRALDLEDGTPKTGWGYSYFDATDRVWGCTYDSRKRAWEKPDYEFALQNKEWWGLAEEPKL